MKKYTRGFTLIELLVVIAIIGILASIVLVSLNSARKKGNDTRVISDVNQIRTALETGYNGSSYVDLIGGQNATCNGGVANLVGASYNNCVLNTAPDNTSISTLVNDATSQGGNIFFTVTGSSNILSNAYAIRGQLVSNSSAYFCIDSTGKTNSNDNVTNTGATTCHP